MNQRNAKRSLDELAKQLRVPQIDLSEERLAALAAAGERIKGVAEYMEFMERNNVSLYFDDGCGPRPMTEQEAQDMLLAFAGVSKADAEIAANYVINVTKMLINRGE